jgi:hypothetical protein
VKICGKPLSFLTWSQLLLLLHYKHQHKAEVTITCCLHRVLVHLQCFCRYAFHPNIHTLPFINMAFFSHKSPAMDLPLCQMNPVHNIKIYLFRNHFNTLPPQSMPKFPCSVLTWSFVTSLFITFLISRMHSICLTHFIFLDFNIPITSSEDDKS